MEHIITTLLLVALALAHLPGHDAYSLAPFLRQGQGSPIALEAPADNPAFLPAAGRGSSLSAVNFLRENLRRPAPASSQNMTPAVLLSMIRLVLYEHGVEGAKAEEVLQKIAAQMESSRATALKRSHYSWNKNRISVQPRVSPFGTKLSPNRGHDQNGGTLLRYGRSSP